MYLLWMGCWFAIPLLKMAQRDNTSCKRTFQWKKKVWWAGLVTFSQCKPDRETTFCSTYRMLISRQTLKDMGTKYARHVENVLVCTASK